MPLSQYEAPSQSSQRPTRMRTVLACTNCRKRKSRCITTEQPPTNPCQRCISRNLVCEYVNVAESEAETSQTHSSSMPMPSAMPASASNGGVYPSVYANFGPPAPAPPLPYTAPPPPNTLPRYAGAAYPSLSLSSQQRQQHDNSYPTWNPQYQGADTPGVLEYSLFAPPPPISNMAHRSSRMTSGQGSQYSSGQYPSSNSHP